MPEKLTILIPCKNERKNIRACIESVRHLADEILVSDSGSTDGTLDIVRSMEGCRVIQREYIDHANFVNWAIPHASNAWVMIIDADERMSDELAADVERVLINPPDQIDGYWVSFECFFMGHKVRFSRWNTDAIRLIRRDRCRNKECRVHPEFVIAPERTGRLRGKLLHYSYWTYDQYLAKYQSYTRLVAHDMWDHGKRAGFYGLFVRPFLRFFQLYFLRLGFLDGLAGLQVCMLTAFYNTFIKQGRLWEMESAIPQPDPEATSRAQVHESLEGKDRSAAA